MKTRHTLADPEREETAFRLPLFSKLALIASLGVLAGCATIKSQPDLSTPSADRTATADWLGNIAMAVDVWPAQIERREAETKGNARHSSSGGSGGGLAGLPLGGDPRAIPVVLGAVLGFAVVGAIVSPGVKAVKAKLDEKEQASITPFTNALAEVNFEQAFKARLLGTIRERNPSSVTLTTIHSFPTKGEFLRDGTRVQTFPQVEVIDASLRESRLRNTPLTFWYTPLKLTVKVRFRITRASNAEELDFDQFTFKSEPHIFTHWTENNAQLLRDALERCGVNLSQRIVRRLFLPPSESRADEKRKDSARATIVDDDTPRVSRFCQGRQQKVVVEFNQFRELHDRVSALVERTESVKITLVSQCGHEQPRPACGTNFRGGA